MREMMILRDLRLSIRDRHCWFCDTEHGFHSESGFFYSRLPSATSGASPQQTIYHFGFSSTSHLNHSVLSTPAWLNHNNNNNTISLLHLPHINNFPEHFFLVTIPPAGRNMADYYRNNPQRRGVLGHVSFGVRSYEISKKFYSVIFAPFGISLVFNDSDRKVLGYGLDAEHEGW